MPYSDTTGWLSQNQWDDHCAFCRAVGKPAPVAHEPGAPAPGTERATAAQKPAKPEFIHVHATGKRVRITDDMKDTRAVAGAWVGGLMAGGAQAAAREIKRNALVSYRVPHDQADKLRYGRVIDANPDTATVQIQEMQPNNSGDDWDVVPSHHFLSFRDVEQVHTRLPDPEADDEQEDSEPLEDGGDSRDEADDMDDESPEKVAASIRRSFGRFYMAWTPPKNKKK